MFKNFVKIHKKGKNCGKLFKIYEKNINQQTKIDLRNEKNW